MYVCCLAVTFSGNFHFGEKIQLLPLPPLLDSHACHTCQFKHLAMMLHVSLLFTIYMGCSYAVYNNNKIYTFAYQFFLTSLFSIPQRTNNSVKKKKRKTGLRKQKSFIYFFCLRKYYTSFQIYFLMSSVSTSLYIFVHCYFETKIYTYYLFVCFMNGYGQTIPLSHKTAKVSATEAVEAH